MHYYTFDLETALEKCNTIDIETKNEFIEYFKNYNFECFKLESDIRYISNKLLIKVIFSHLLLKVENEDENDNYNKVKTINSFIWINNKKKKNRFNRYDEHNTLLFAKYFFRFYNLDLNLNINKKVIKEFKNEYDDEYFRNDIVYHDERSLNVIDALIEKDIIEKEAFFEIYFEDLAIDNSTRHLLIINMDEIYKLKTLFKPINEKEYKTYIIRNTFK